MNVQEILGLILNGGVWSISSQSHIHPFKSYIYRGRVFIKHIEGDKLIHLGYIKPNGLACLNKKYQNSKKYDIIHLKQFLNELYNGVFGRDWLFCMMDEEAASDIYVSQDELQDENNWIYRLGV